MGTLKQKTELDCLAQQEREAAQKSRILNWILVVLTLAMLNLTMGCKSYFKVNVSVMPPSVAITELKDAGKTIILHFNDKKWVLSNIQIKNDVVTGKLFDYNKPPTIHPVRPDHPNVFKVKGSKNKGFLLDEVHLYVTDFDYPDNKLVSIPVKSIVRMEIYENDRPDTIGSWALGSVGLVAGIILIVVVLTSL